MQFIKDTNNPPNSPAVKNMFRDLTNLCQSWPAFSSNITCRNKLHITYILFSARFEIRYVMFWNYWQLLILWTQVYQIKPTTLLGFWIHVHCLCTNSPNLKQIIYIFFLLDASFKIWTCPWIVTFLTTVTDHGSSLQYNVYIIRTSYVNMLVVKQWKLPTYR